MQLDQNGPTDFARISALAAAKKRFLELAEREECEESLMRFLERGWQYIDPAPFQPGWHLEAIAEHLQAVTDGQIRRLLITVPPRTSKSTLCSVAWPAWTWAQSHIGPISGPQVQFLSTSYSHTLSLRDSVKTRRLVQSPWYKKHWGERFYLTGDVNTKGRFENSKGGYRLATSVDGTTTGEGGSVILVDDAHSATEAESDTVRQNTIIWWSETMQTRLSDPATGAFVVIMQRLHEDDLAGYILSKSEGDWIHVMIPMEHDQSRHCITYVNGEKFWEDPRTEDGELLCPNRFSRESVDTLKAALGPFAAAGQLDQAPSPRGGGIIKREYWKLWEDDKPFPPFEYLIGSLDTAYTSKEENDQSALTIWGVFRDENRNPRVMLVWAWAGHLEFPELCTFLVDHLTVDSRSIKDEDGNSIPRFPIHTLVIEAKAAGFPVGQELYRIVGQQGKFGIFFPNQARGKYTQDKVARVYSIQHIFADGMVYAPRKKWADDLVISQCEKFPKGSRDDLVDCTSMGLRYLRDIGLLMRREEQAIDEAEEMRYRSREEPLYPV